MNRYIALAAISVGCSSIPAHAHVIFDQPQAAIGKTYLATLRVTHGCNGSATTEMSVSIPPGFVGVKPQPKSGWQVKTTKAPYDHPYESMHGTLAEGVKTITWSNGNLPNDFTDEFKFTGLVDKALQPASSLYFPVIQKCENGEYRWTEIPDGAASPHSLQSPAPALRLVAAGDRVADMRGVVVEQPWSRATPNGAKVAAGYLSVTNKGPSDDRLVSVSSDISDRASVHEMTMKDGVMSMHAVDGGLAIPAGQTITLKPGSYHLMFEDLKRPLKQGERYDATLTFEKAGPIHTTFDVGGIGATAPANAMPGMDMNMKH